MEIEKKYLVGQLPENLADYEKWEIEQCYLCPDPTIRIRKKNDSYILTYKNRQGLEEEMEKERLNIAQEIEMPLTKAAYYHLKEKADGNCLQKTRYRIPYGSYCIELDIFHGEYDGFCLAEVEFPTVEAGRSFCPPAWFLEDVSNDIRYTNSYMAKAHKNFFLS